jgi:DNA recombination protein RmuC
MDGVLLVIVIVLLVVIAMIQLFSLVRKTPVDLNPLQQALRSLEQSGDRTERSIREEIAKNRVESAQALRQSREELAGALKGFGDTLYGQFGLLTQTTDKKLDRLREAVEQRLLAIQADNAKQLDQMRATVDEKLQGTLEKRLGESFKLVSERLEQVSKGLGEMQSLAAGVGDLKKVLTNVKTRGTWGEVQLGAMLEQALTPDQYAANVAVKEGGERVEFAIKLPGRGEDGETMVWLPVDAKFPVEDYQRLLDAQEKADADSAEGAAKQLEARIRQCAGDICSKYLSPPKTTDFGILFLPTEGLFAEVIRRTGLVEFVQRECRVVIAGPTTLWALLNSLQMGFRTLVIQKRSSEVWNLLSAVKTEWTKYGDVLTKVQKKIHEASDTIEQAQTRTRAIGRKLKDVQELPATEAE